MKWQKGLTNALFKMLMSFEKWINNLKSLELLMKGTFKWLKGKISYIISMNVIYLINLEEILFA